MKKLITLFAASLLFLTGCNVTDNNDDVSNNNAEVQTSLFESIKGSWKAGHAVYTVTDGVVDFDHFDQETGLEDFGMEMTIKRIIIDKEIGGDSTITLITEIDTITTKAGWMTGELNGYATFHAKNIVPGTNVDFIRIGTPGFAKDPLYTDAASAKASEFPADTLKFWKTYDPKAN